jgi:hypothetical protein
MHATNKPERVCYDVAPRGDQWTVTRRGAARATAVLATQHAAVAKAADLAKHWRESQVVIHGADGRIQDERTYGTDPFPPRG